MDTGVEHGITGMYSFKRAGSNIELCVCDHILEHVRC